MQMKPYWINRHSVPVVAWIVTGHQPILRGRGPRSVGVDGRESLVLQGISCLQFSEQAKEEIELLALLQSLETCDQETCPLTASPCSVQWGRVPGRPLGSRHCREGKPSV